MEPFINQFPALPIVGLGAAYFFFKTFVNSLIQSYGRITTRTFTLEDNAKYFGKSDAVATQDTPLVQRASGCWRNDLENIPSFLFLALVYALMGGDSQIMGWMMGFYCATRTLHTLFYIKLIQPHRMIAFQAGMVCHVALVAQVVLLSLKLMGKNL
jgi:uncharacterized MAPEG superfamily protein